MRFEKSKVIPCCRLGEDWYEVDKDYFDRLIQDLRSISNDLREQTMTNDFELVEDWTPQNGEIIEVWASGEDVLDPFSGKDWHKRKFIGKHDGKFICTHIDDKHYFYVRWDEARQLKETHEITIDGKNIEISRESYEALKESLNDNS